MKRKNSIYLGAQLVEELPIRKEELLGKIDFKSTNFRRFLAGFMIIIILGLGYNGYRLAEINSRAVDIYIGSNKIGVLRDKDIARQAMEELRLDLSNTYNADIVFQDSLAFEATHAKDDDISSVDDLKRKMKPILGFLVSGYVITIEGEEVGAVKSQEEAELIISKIKEPYLEELNSEKVKDVKIIEDIQIVNKEIPLDNISQQSDIMDFINTSTEEMRTHTIEAGESFWAISTIYNIDYEELIKANPGKDSKKLKPGDEINLMLPKERLTVATIEEIEYTAEVDYETVEELDGNMYTNEKKIKTKGAKGVSKIVANEIRHNGIVIDKEIISEEVIKKPINELVVKGSKERPKTMATGSFLMPTRGRISSRYGMRNGRMHRGLDIASSVGTAINASDGGTVTFSGYKSSYGNLIEIDHGNGYKTRYAHCSKLHVKKGDKVYRGQHIANMGSTGRSTGSHLHLEVIKSGVHQNPSRYVK